MRRVSHPRALRCPPAERTAVPSTPTSLPGTPARRATRSPHPSGTRHGRPRRTRQGRGPGLPSPTVGSSAPPLDQGRCGDLLDVEINPHRAQEIDDLGDRTGQTELLAPNRDIPAAVLVCGVHDHGRRQIRSGPGRGRSAGDALRSSRPAPSCGRARGGTIHAVQISSRRAGGAAHPMTLLVSLLLRPSPADGGRGPRPAAAPAARRPPR